MMSVPNVAIIGAGLAGPTMALCLKKQHGIPCTIYELRPGPDDRGTNITLTPNAIRVLQRIGVYDKLRTQGYSYQNLALSNGSGEELARFWNGSESSYNFNALRIHRKKVQNALLEETRAQGIEIFYDMKLDRIIDDSETGVRLEFENGTVITADLVVGADGIHSRVRPAVSSVEPIYSGYFGITGLMGGHQLDKSLENFHLPNMFFGRTGFMAIMPSSFDGTEVGFFSTMEIAERTRDEWEDLFHKPEKIRDILTGRFTDGSWPALVRNICRDVPATTLASWPFYIVPNMDHYASATGRVIVIGDAAHAITPQGGQGAAMAFEDTETLAYTISQLDFVGNWRKLLGIWEKHRQERLEMVKDFTNRNASLRDPGRGYLRQKIKEYIVWGVFKYMGPSAGVEWLYGYNAEDIVGILRPSCESTS